MPKVLCHSILPIASTGEEVGVQEHGFEFEVDATPEEVWRALHPRLAPRPPGDPLVIEHGDVRIEIHQTYPLKDAAVAHRDLQARKTTGSTVLLP